MKFLLCSIAVALTQINNFIAPPIAKKVNSYDFFNSSGRNQTGRSLASCLSQKEESLCIAGTQECLVTWLELSWLPFPKKEEVAGICIQNYATTHALTTPWSLSGQSLAGFPSQKGRDSVYLMSGDLVRLFKIRAGSSSRQEQSPYSWYSKGSLNSATFPELKAIKASIGFDLIKSPIQQIIQY